MPLPFVTLDRVRLAAPDGSLLSGELTVAFGAERTGVVGANGVGKSTLLHVLSGERAAASGTVHRRGRVTLVRQTRAAHADDTVADVLGIRARLAALARLERGDGDDADLLLVADAWDLPEQAARALARFGVGHLDFERPIRTTSGGEATRVALAAAWLEAPDLLLLDEPTDHLDAAGRAAVAEAIAGWRAGLVVVSHDRALLGGVDRILELTGIGAKLYGGNHDAWRAQREVEREAAARTLAAAERAVDEVRRAAQAAREARASRDAKGRRDRGGGSQPAWVQNHWKQNAEALGTRLSRAAERQESAATEQLAEARSAVEIRQALAAALPTTGLATGRRVLVLDGVAWGPPGRPELFAGIDLELVGPCRVAVVGPNGTGKSTLLGIAAGTVAPGRGRVVRPVPARLLDQRAFDLDPRASLLDNLLARWPGTTKNAAHALLGRFLFPDRDAHRLVGGLSGGQRARAALAIAVGPAAPPPLLLLDEPTNHLDPETVEAILDTLAGYDGALLVASHDEAVLTGLGVERRVELG